jgi:outer membrane immunogenic protein
MSKTRTSLIGLTLTSALVLSAYSANAADMYVPGPGGYKDSYVPVASWTGFYVGANGGIGVSEADVHIPAYPFPDHHQGGNGFVGGGQAGYNYQINHFVIGVEGDFSGSNVTSDALSGNGGTEHYKIEEDWRASIRGRLGYAFDKTLFYGTAGAGFVDLNTRYVPLAGGIKSATLSGYMVGGGAEFAFTPHWIGRAEYLFGSYDTEHFVHLGPSSVDYETHEFRLGLSYKFGSVYEPLK